MQLAFKTQSLRTLCEDAEAAELALGGSVAQELRKRLADIRAAAVVDELPVGNVTLRGTGVDGTVRIDLGGRAALELVPNHPTQRLTTQCAVEWGRVSRLKVVRIGTLDD